MAGTCRPDSSIYECGEEMTDYILVEGSLYSGNGSGLIDQSAPNNWSSNDVAFWYEGRGNYVTFKFNKPCYIWRCGTAGWAGSNDELKVMNLDTNKEVTSEVNISKPTAITNSQWEKFAFISKPGTYKFWNRPADRRLRLDSEWFFETVPGRAYVLDKNGTVINSSVANENTNLIDLDKLINLNLYTPNKVLIGFKFEGDSDDNLITSDFILEESKNIVPVFKDITEFTGGSQLLDKYIKYGSITINKRKEV